MKFIKLISISSLIVVGALLEAKTWIFSYNKTDSDSGGLCFAKSSDLKNWEYIGGKDRAFFNSNLGAWGDKKMKELFLYRDKSGTWRCIWSISWDVPSFGHNTSLSQTNLVDWRRQTLQDLGKDVRVSAPVVYSDRSGNAILQFKGNDGKFYQTKTKDFKKFSALKEISESQYTKDFERFNKRITIDGRELVGQINEADEAVMKTFESGSQWDRTAPWFRGGESAKDDEKRFANLESVSAKIKADLSASKKISDKLFGIFFEDINYAADGGLYAELIQNRDFEYSNRDVWDWKPLTAWTVEGSEAIIGESDPIHENNKHYLSVKSDGKNTRISNPGYGKFENGKFAPGIVLKKGDKYDFSAFVRGDVSQSAVRLLDSDGKPIAEGKINSASKDWKKVELVLKATSDTKSGRLEIQPLSA